MSSLLHSNISIRISDPWELGEALRWEPINAEIIGVNGDDILIQLLKPFDFKGTSCEFFIASPRHEGDHAVELLNVGSLFCGMTRITTNQARSNNPFDLSNWRGGIAIIGNLDLRT